MFTLPPLPYAYNALEPWIDEETMHLHHDKHHQTYVDNLNKLLAGNDTLLNMDISKLVTSLDQVPEDIRQKVRNNAGGHFNHSLFWTLMSPAKEEVPQKYQEFIEPFNAAALSIFGSGWAWLIEEDGVIKIETTPNQDNPLMRNPKVSIITGLDVWEHAYYLKYKNVRADYIKNWWNVANWTS